MSATNVLQMLGAWGAVLLIGAVIGFVWPIGGKYAAALLFAAPFLLALPVLASADGLFSGLIGKEPSGTAVLYGAGYAGGAAVLGFGTGWIGSRLRQSRGAV